MPISTTTARASIKKLNSESASLTPSALVTMFEIDITEIADSKNLVFAEEGRVFRFHNSIKLTTSDIYWKGKKYTAAPIRGEGFEFNGRGKLPTPKLGITVHSDGKFALSTFKSRLNDLGDIVGAKVTRIRTFAKYIDSKNFTNDEAPYGFEPDQFAEFPRDVFFIDRKSSENSTSIEFQLASRMDIEGLQLPRRRVLANRCSWKYRGEGCLYEYEARRNSNVHGATSDMPASAPAKANNRDELISDVLNIDSFTDRGEWDALQSYIAGDEIFIEKDGVKYYFVAKNSSIGIPPPSLTYWVEDACSKLRSGCRIRHKGIGNGTLPFGGYPGADRVQ
jgi:lambda family phage minor tail protein L